jgi:TatD DNase family protein
MNISHDIIDTHAHMCDEAFRADLPAVFERARQASVAAMVAVAENEEMWMPVLACAGSRADIAAALGVHPYEADRYGSVDARNELQARLRQCVSASPVAAIGETGLDYFKNQASPEHQKALFALLCGIARDLHLPVIIHCRQAYADMHAIVDEYYPVPAASARPHGVVHCFSGDIDDARRLCARGFMLGIDGPVTYPSARLLKDVVRAVGLENMVLETDCPYLPPQPYRGARNEPAYLSAVAAAVADIKQISYEEVARVTTANARRCFWQCTENSHE